MEAVQQLSEQRVKTPQQWALENLKGLFPNVNRAEITQIIKHLPKFTRGLTVEIFPSYDPKEMGLIFRNNDQLGNNMVITDSDSKGHVVIPKQFILIVQLRGNVQNVEYPHIELFTKMSKRQIKALTMKTVGYIPPRWIFPSIHIS